MRKSVGDRGVVVADDAMHLPGVCEPVIQSSSHIRSASCRPVESNQQDRALEPRSPVVPYPKVNWKELSNHSLPNSFLASASPRSSGGFVWGDRVPVEPVAIAWITHPLERQRKQRKSV